MWGNCGQSGRPSRCIGTTPCREFLLRGTFLALPRCVTPSAGAEVGHRLPRRCVAGFGDFGWPVPRASLRRTRGDCRRALRCVALRLSGSLPGLPCSAGLRSSRLRPRVTSEPRPVSSASRRPDASLALGLGLLAIHALSTLSTAASPRPLHALTLSPAKAAFAPRHYWLPRPGSVPRSLGPSALLP